MKKAIISIILILTIVLPSFADINSWQDGEYANAGITTYYIGEASHESTGLSLRGYNEDNVFLQTSSGTTEKNIFPEGEIKIADSPLIICEADNECGDVQRAEPNAIENSISTYTSSPISNESFVFNPNLLSSFNTITGPIAGNGAREPKYSYNKFFEESISDYSGELTLNFEDLVLAGRNGLDLRIGRTYQTVAANPGEKTLMILPDSNGYLQNKFAFSYSTYLTDRYNLGLGWGFGFPSIQIETEYIPVEVADTYYYEKHSQLYYHSGNGEVYQVQFTSDATDSNLKGYYNKDIQFNSNDTTYSNGQATSYYSMTLTDKTKQYFAADGRLIGIADRFGNTIKFEHTLKNTTNIVPDGNFASSGTFWSSSVSSTGSEDAVYRQNTDIGSDDGYVMYFRKNNANQSFIISSPIQVKPLTGYKLGIRFKSQSGEPVKAEITGYDTAYNLRNTKNLWITDYNTDEWVDFSSEFTTSSAVRYIQLKIIPESARYTYIDTITLDEPKPLISKITDTIGRTVEFEYNGSLSDISSTGAVKLTVTSPNGSTKELTYNKITGEFMIASGANMEKRFHWYLGSSLTEGEDGEPVSYTYGSGITDENGEAAPYPALYQCYSSKSHSASDSRINKPVLTAVRYKDRKKIYEYETVRKHLGDDGYHDTLRVKKKYDMYSYVPEGDTKSYFKGELDDVDYSYSGLYNGNSFNNETGYPDYTFDDETALNEQWTVTKTGKTTDTITFSNCAVINQSRSSDGTTVTSDYTNHAVFRNSPVEIKNTVMQNGSSRTTYILYSYNDWGGIASETKEIDEEIKCNASLLEKHKTTYEYNEFYYITQKSYYNNIDSPQVYEINTFNSNGLLTTSENAVKEKINYYYENSAYPFLLTKTTMDDPMKLNNLKGGDRIVNYSYDSYGLYPITISEAYDGGTANTSYIYDYITGDVLVEILPDNSYTEYTYYSDGKVKYVISPLSQYTNGRSFYTIERHNYGSNYMVEGYGAETQTFDMEQIIKYYVFTDTGASIPYSFDLNFYDAVGNLKQNQRGYFKEDNTSTAYLRSITQYYHDSYDRLVKTVDSENHSTIYTYDGFDRPLTVTDCENNIYSYTYNSVQNKVDLSLNGATESTDRQLMTQYFDLYGNVTENVVYPNNSSQTLSETYEYDLNNNTISYTNANDNKTVYLYDAANRLREADLPNGVKAISSYSAFNKPAFEKIYDSNGVERSARITYRNEKGDLSLRFFNYDRRMADSDGYSYDAKGRITSIREGENNFLYTYDESDHPIILISGENEIHRSYNWFGEVASASTDGNTPEVRYGYDVLGNLGAKSQNGDYLMSYVYSPIGNITQSTMPSSRTESYTYTANGNLDTIVSDNKTFDYDYYDTGYVKSITYPNGLKTTYYYDNINRVTSMTTTKGTTTINTLLYEYDSNGNVVLETRNGAETTYTYDSLDRLLSVTYSDSSSVSYEYDALNNRTKETYSNGDVKDYVYDTKYQLKEIKLNGQITDTFTYNESGAVVTHNGKTYTYDEWDRMSGYSDGTNTYTYKYDANGIRTQKNDKQYIIDINNNVVAETDSTGAVTDEILWGHQPLARKTNGSWYYYIYNAHGDVVGLINEAGTVVNTYEYTPWGEIRNETEIVDNPIKYAGEYYDDELDMIYLRARYYNPQIGRFTSLDIEEGEISNPLDMNRYVYCRNNPIKYVDPTGEAVVIAGIAITGELLALIGTGIVILGYLASKAFVNAFTSAINTGKSIRDSIIYAKGKSKDPTPPSKLKDGDKVKTPDTHPDEFNKKKDGSYEHKKTGWKFKRDYSRHGGDHWDASPDGKSGNYINVNPNGTIR